MTEEHLDRLLACLERVALAIERHHSIRCRFMECVEADSRVEALEKVGLGTGSGGKDWEALEARGIVWVETRLNYDGLWCVQWEALQCPGTSGRRSGSPAARSR